MTETVAVSEQQNSGLRIGLSLSENLVWAALITFILIALAVGWVRQSELPINPEFGLGYWLGIIGGSMMLILLYYSARKRFGILRVSGSIGFWFRFHMVMGMLGPTLILFHSRFSTGSALNSQVALLCMMIVMGSGFIGRFFYARVHRGYSGRKLEVRSLLTDMHDQLGCLSQLGEDGVAVKALLVPYEQRAVAAGGSFWRSAKSVVVIGFSSRLTALRLRFLLGRMARDNRVATASRKNILRLAKDILKAVRRAAAFAFYDRMLRLWHLLHLPLLFLLLATGILHVVAVHQY